MVLTLVVNKQEGNFWCLLPFIIMGCWHPLYLLDGNSAARLMLHKGIKNTREKSNFTPCEYYSRSKSIANIKCLFAYPDLGENSAIYPINRYCSKQKGLDGEIDTKDYSIPDVLLLYPKSMQNKWSLSRKIIHCWPRIVESRRKKSCTRCDVLLSINGIPKSFSFGIGRSGQTSPLSKAVAARHSLSSSWNRPGLLGYADCKGDNNRCNGTSHTNPTWRKKNHKWTRKQVSKLP